MARSEKLATETLPAGPGNHVSRRAFLFAAGALAMTGCANENTPAPTSEPTVTTPDWDATETGAPQTAGPSDVETTPVATSDPTEIKIKQREFDVSGPDVIDYDDAKRLNRITMRQVVDTFQEIAQHVPIVVEEQPVSIGLESAGPVLHYVQEQQVPGGVISIDRMVYITADEGYNSRIRFEFIETQIFQSDSGGDETSLRYPDETTMMEIQLKTTKGNFDDSDLKAGQVMKALEETLAEHDLSGTTHQTERVVYSRTNWKQDGEGEFISVVIPSIVEPAMATTVDKEGNEVVLPQPRKVVVDLLKNKLPGMAK